jgi:hypothetical protein
MADSYTISTLKITSASFSKNPCSINEKIVITVVVSEQTLTLEASTIYAGEIYAGER